MEILLLKSIIVLANILILAFLLFLIFDHFKASNNTLSWSVAFYFFSLGWLLLRGIFWMLTLTSTTEWSAFKFYFLYWVPVPMEFGSFLLVPLFFAHVLYPTEWRTYEMFARPIYIFGTCCLTIFTILWSVFSAVEQREQIECADDVTDDITFNECFRTEYSGWIFRVLTVICFLFLATIQAAFGFKFYQLEDTKDWKILGRLFASRDLLTTVNILVTLSFVSRAIYQWVVMTYPQIHLPNVFLQNERDVRPSIFIMVMAWDYIPTTLLLLTIVSRSSGTGNILNINHRLRGYSNPDDFVDSYSRQFHHFGAVESLSNNPSPGDNGKKTNEVPEGSYCGRFCSALWNFCSGSAEEIDGDEQIRLVIPKRQPPDQKQPPQGRIPDDPYLHRYQMTTLPPPPNSWRAEAGLTPIPYQDEVTSQRCWLNSSSRLDKDECAASSLVSLGKSSCGSSLEDQRKVTPLELRMAGDSRVSSIRWSGYAPFSNSPAREPFGGGGGGGGGLPPLNTAGLQQSSSGVLLHSLTSSPTSSITSFTDRPPSTSLRTQHQQQQHHHQPSYGSANGNPHSREVGNSNYGRITPQAQHQWYQQQQQQRVNEDSFSDGMIVGSYHDSRSREQIF